jgi:hypothetical protein
MRERASCSTGCRGLGARRVPGGSCSAPGVDSAESCLPTSGCRKDSRAVRRCSTDRSRRLSQRQRELGNLFLKRSHLGLQASQSLDLVCFLHGGEGKRTGDRSRLPFFFRQKESLYVRGPRDAQRDEESEEDGIPCGVKKLLVDQKRSDEAQRAAKKPESEKRMQEKEHEGLLFHSSRGRATLKRCGDRELWQRQLVSRRV